ncbi:carbohydrate ABC transporter permease [Novibacillus thermophilus]|uniref:ABC transporter permease n=1 Tax=Novibacillus thermophilus TaxID=1471761 RepID=A0A1U9K461_9BACL|nr:sugar ABC transporter permease [Novibacillus thermophilus]AQS54814.1 ABC transporter permease [Novibacillus thermophilus]
MSHTKKHYIIAYLFLLPWFVGFFGLVLGPMISSLYLSFTEYRLLTPPEWIGLQNYTDMFRDSDFISSVKVTAVFVLIGVPLQLLVALSVALLLNKGLSGIGFYRTIYYIPSLLGGSVAIALLWKNIFGTDGIVNDFLSLFGVQGRGWVSHPDYAIYTLILLSAWQFGSSMVIFLAGLKQIPPELYEAAAVDGANGFMKFKDITLPLLSPVILFNLVMVLIKSLQAFTSAYVVSEGTGGPANSTLFYTLYLYLKGFSFFDMGYASAMAWLLLVVLALLTFIIFLSSKYWVYYEYEGRSS